METEWQRTSVRENSQEVGLEAAILQRVRNSSLVECRGTENVSRLKCPTEAVDLMRRDGKYPVRAMRW